MKNTKRILFLFVFVFIAMSSIVLSHAESKTVQRPVITEFKIESTSVDSVSLSWKTQQKVKGVRLYIYDKDKGAYKTIYKKNKASFTAENLTPGEKYDFLLKVYVLKDDCSKYYSKKVYLSAYTKLSKVKGLKLDSTSAQKQKISWSAVDGADGYKVYYLNTKTGKYSLLGTTKKTSCSFSKLKSATEYTYKIKAFSKTDDKTVYSKASSAFKTTTRPDTVKNVKISNATSDGYTISWQETKGANGYKVYVLDNQTGKYKAFKTLKNAQTSFSVSGKEVGETSKYKIKSYLVFDSTRYYSSFSEPFTASTKPEKVTVTNVQRSENNSTVFLEWTQSKGADGYLIYVSQHKNSGFSLKKTVTGSQSCTLQISKNDTAHYVKIKPYIIANGKYIYGDYSRLVTV